MKNKVVARVIICVFGIILLTACGSPSQESELAFELLSAEELQHFETSPEFQLAQQRHEESAAQTIPNLDELLDVIGVDHTYELEPNVTYFVSPDRQSYIELRDDELTTQSALVRAQTG